MKTAPNRTRAISLIEIVMAINATALLMALLCQLLLLPRRQLHETEVRLGGALLAQNALEEYMTVPLDEWPTEPFRMEGDWRKIQLSWQPWNNSARLVRATAVVLSGDEERYRLETVLFR
jgi:hypothetical protein